MSTLLKPNSNKTASDEGEKTDNAKCKVVPMEEIENTIESNVNDLMKQIELLKPAMDDAGFKLVDISFTMQSVPIMSYHIESTNDNGCWNDDKVEQKLDSVGTNIVTSIKQAEKTRFKFNKLKSVRFKSLRVETRNGTGLLTLFLEPNNTEGDTEGAEHKEL